MSFMSSDINQLPAHVQAIFRAAGKLPGPAVGGYGTGVAPTTGDAPATGGYISPFGGSPFPYNMDTGGVGGAGGPGGYQAKPPQAVGEVLPSTPMRVRPIGRTRLMAMKRGYRPGADGSQYLPRDYVQKQLQMANATPKMGQHYG